MVKQGGFCQVKQKNPPCSRLKSYNHIDKRTGKAKGRLPLFSGFFASENFFKKLSCFLLRFCMLLHLNRCTGVLYSYKDLDSTKLVLGGVIDVDYERGLLDRTKTSAL